MSIRVWFCCWALAHWITVNFLLISKQVIVLFEFITCYRGNRWVTVIYLSIKLYSLFTYTRKHSLNWVYIIPLMTVTQREYKPLSFYKLNTIVTHSYTHSLSLYIFQFFCHIFHSFGVPTSQLMCITLVFHYVLMSLWPS